MSQAEGIDSDAAAPGRADAARAHPGSVPLADDEGQIFSRVRSQLRDSKGRSYEQLRGTTPRYAAVWLQVLGAELMLVAIATGLLASESAGLGLRVVAGSAGALGIGYVVAFLNLWLHEAVHYHVHPDREANDWLARLVFGPLVGLDVKSYRLSHFQHHARLGRPDDPERSYFEPLNARFVLEACIPLAALKTLATYSAVGRASPDPRSEGSPGSGMRVMLFLAMLLHASVIGLALMANAWTLAIAWALGVGAVFPLLARLRQLLEHRRGDASDATDYSEVAHGAFTRVFSAGPFSSTFGGAGFNRHLIHHWDPQLSCTVFPEVEAYLEDSQLGDFYRSRRTSYLAAARTLSRRA